MDQMMFLITLMVSIVSLITAIPLYQKMNMNPTMFYKNWRVTSQRMPLEMRVLVFVIGIFVYILFADILKDNVLLFYSSHAQMAHSLAFFYIVFSLVIFYAGGALLLSALILQGKYFLDDIKDWETLTSMWEKSKTNNFLQFMQTVFENRAVATKAIFVCIVIIASAYGVPFAIIGSHWIGELSLIIYGVLFFAVTIPTFIYGIRKIAYYNQITAAFEKVAAGESIPDIKVKGKSTMAMLAKNMNEIKSEIKFSKKEQVKSERLKTELITNVSHDLRTPLTSIITYADLLKKTDISQDERDSYVEIIDRKSKRLKVLIDDLFEVSKMASGNIELQKNNVDIVQLLQQSLAEYDEKIDQSSLQFRVTHQTKPMYATVDGPKVWRVFDNIINNILKYSMEHTRVYIETVETEQEVMITFKNVTKYEIGGNTEELFQRFKRGDTSRHTEGSGLGLAIAQSIIDLHDGSLQLEVDGDLFKVTVKIPK